MKTALVGFAVALCACADNTTGTFDPLPISSRADAPTVTDVWFKCWQEVELFLDSSVKLTDAQGIGDVVSVTAKIYKDAAATEAWTTVALEKCEGCPQFDFSHTNYNYSSAATPMLMRMCASSSWPVEIEAIDKAGNVTTGVVLARVMPL
jgi:hypothetical protein